MAEMNKLCSMCDTKLAQFACRCIYPSVLLCPECLAPHFSKTTDALHSPSPITPADLEEKKAPKNQDRKTKLKEFNK